MCSIAVLHSQVSELGKEKCLRNGKGRVSFWLWDFVAAAGKALHLRSIVC
jgi:hypothetical protein